MAERPLDLDEWPRASHYRFFRNVAQPHLSLTVPVDVTRLVADLKPADDRSAR